MINPPNWKGLPPNLRHDPHILDLRVSHLEARHDAMREKLEEPQDDGRIETPVGRLPWQLVVFIVCGLLWLKPDLFAKLLMLVVH